MTKTALGTLEPRRLTPEQVVAGMKCWTPGQVAECIRLLKELLESEAS